MQSFQERALVFLFLHPFSLLLLLLLFLFSIFRLLPPISSTPKKNLPPSPPRLPIIGNLHQLGTHPYRSLQTLSQKYGDLMLLHLGSKPAIIVSSAQVASQVLKTHDLIFASRPDKLGAFKRILANGKDMLSSPYGEYYRQMRSMWVQHLMSAKRVRSFRVVREEELALMMKSIQSGASSMVNLSDMFISLTNDVVCRLAFGKKYIGEKQDGVDFKKLLDEVFKLLGDFHIGDYISWMGWIDQINGVNAKDIFAAGTVTSSAALEWMMSELLRNPRVMKELQKEVRGIVGDKEAVTEDDLKNMKYLKAVIKETLRLHPSAPLTPPHISTEDVKINGYDVAKGTLLLVNLWAISRDPVYWEEPESFYPERFLDSPIDFKGRDFQLIPFGSGRRICPGMAFAIANLELVMANLMHQFDWALPKGIDEESLDMIEDPTLVVHRKTPLFVIPTPRIA